MKWTRDQYVELMSFGGHPRPMFVELFGPLVGLEDEWRRQGAEEDELNLTAFDFDHVDRVRVGHCKAFDMCRPQVLEETETVLIQRDSLGRTTKLDKRTATIPLPLDFPVRSMDDWLRYRPLFAFRADRIDWDEVERAKAAQAAGALVMATIPGAYDTVRDLMGEEQAALAYYDQPELIADIMTTLRDTAIRTLGPISERLVIDQLSVHEDLAGKSGPMVGPVQVQEHFTPYFSAVWSMLRERGTRLFAMDTDGNVNPILDALLACGLTEVFPMEPAAGMDIVKLREKYGRRLAFRGGIDKFVVRTGTRRDIRRELEYKLQPAVRDGGGVAFGLDHRIPNGTPLESYRFYVDTARDILGLPARDVSRRGWARMAF